VYRKPGADFYTVLLVVALLALLIGILFLCLDMSTYQFQYKGGPAVGMLMDQGPGDRGQRSGAAKRGLPVSGQQSAFGGPLLAVG
jgi:nitrogen fixation-related uncharacterized protein